MSLKELIGQWFGFNAKIKELEQDFTAMQDNRNYWHDKYDVSKSELTAYALKFSNLQNLVKPVDVPSADITYRRPILIGKNNWVQQEIDVRLFVQPDFEIEHSLEAKKLVYDGTQDLDILIPKIYHFAKKNYMYGSDEQFGFSEYVEFPFEFRVELSKKVNPDCDGWANWIGAHLVAAKIPVDRWFVSFGLANAGYGHATIEIKASDNTWHHLNSTKLDYDYKDLKQYPLNYDPNDRPGITKDGFWLSYNNVFSVHAFENKAAEEAFANAKLTVSIV